MAGGSGDAGEALGLPPGPGEDCGLHTMPDMTRGSRDAGEALGLPPGPGEDCGLHHQGEQTTDLTAYLTDDWTAEQEICIGPTLLPVTSR